jgi:hypothetical protein
MITVKHIKINTLDQNLYDNLINLLNIQNISCTCGHSACLIKHAYYERKLKSNDGQMLTLSILRLKCSVCGKTHAVLPECIVPYSQISLDDQIEIIDNYLNHKSQEDLMISNSLIDESNVSHVLRNFLNTGNNELLH